MDYIKPDVVTSYHLSALMSQASGFASGAGCGTLDDSSSCDWGGPKSIYPDGDF